MVEDTAASHEISGKPPARTASILGYLLWRHRMDDRIDRHEGGCCRADTAREKEVGGWSSSSHSAQPC
jgi:hypothetical protein